VAAQKFFFLIGSGQETFFGPKAAHLPQNPMKKGQM